MKKLLGLLISTVASWACSIDQNYLECLYKYMISKPFDLNGVFYQYDFNKDGYIQKNDWVYYDLPGQKFYRLMGRPSSATDVFGWQPIPTSALADLDADHPAGVFVFLGFPGEYDSRFSWAFVPWGTAQVYKLSGQASNGSFLYLDLDCDGRADPLIDMSVDFQTSSVLLPGTEGPAGMKVRFVYTGSYGLNCQSGSGWSSSFYSSSSSWSGSSGGNSSWSNSFSSSWSSGWSSSVSSSWSSWSSISSSSWSSGWSSSYNSSSSYSSMIGGCFDMISYETFFVNKNLVEHHVLPLYYMSGVHLQDGYVLGGALDRPGLDGVHIVSAGIVTKIGKDSQILWSRAILPVDAEDMIDGVYLLSMRPDRFLLNTNYYRHGFSVSYGNIVGIMDRYGNTRYLNLYFLNEPGIDRLHSGTRLIGCTVLRSQEAICYGELELSLPATRYTTRVLPTPQSSSDCGCGDHYSSSSSQVAGRLKASMAYAFVIDANGNVKWAKAYDGATLYQQERPNTEEWKYDSIVQVQDGLVVLGSNHNTIEGVAPRSLLLAKMNPNGELQWATTLYNRQNLNRELYGQYAIEKDGRIYATFSESSPNTSTQEANILVMNEYGHIQAIRRLTTRSPINVDLPLYDSGVALYVDAGDNIYVLDYDLHTTGMIPSSHNFFLSEDGMGASVIGLDILQDAGVKLTKYDMAGNGCRTQNTIPLKQPQDISGRYEIWSASQVIEFDLHLDKIPYRVINSDDVEAHRTCYKDRGTICIN